MTIALYVAATAAFAVCFALSIIDSMHFFQLNSYRFDTHTKWMRENYSRYLSHMMLAVLMLIVILLTMNIDIKAALFILLFAIGCLIEKPKKAKKPLVYTARVKRMLVTISLLVIIAGVVAVPLCFAYEKQSYLLMIYACFYLISPVMVIIANVINKPIELSINRGYTNDAKRILAECPDLKIIGVTGSYGKTSVKYYLNTLLRAKYNVLMTPESYNTPMGVVKTIRGSLKATHEIFICEMGAKWVGDIKELCDIVHPHHGIITSIGPQHLESFKTLDAVKNTKFELSDALPQDGMLFLNGDDENIRDHGSNRPAFTYSIGGDADYTAFDVAVTDRGTTFSVKAPNGETEKYTTRLIGRHNVLNIVGAIAVCHKLGISLAELKGQVRKLEGVPHRLELSEKNGVTIIDDAYNSNPSGTKAALEALSLFDGYKILVTPGMVELGEKQEELNREFGRNAAKVCDYVVLVGQKQAIPIKAGLLDEKYDENKIFVANTINEALTHVYALNSMGKKKIILLENDLPDNY
ncbi:MAG: UDP-N-acetylmuramoyl-tripeptide--D-alanyl-D-alanine ligase [Faecalibacterium sp.]|nr:UDP-N-acetylmuramoyl-tripeptide--D-alanyl-D-alanine ligase [Ruminococcus sp.]MCM1393136.1 UDP-N-acetylmuramoyl-tripeptide--D-alanyl-D-alanine ligase [Ruminococcus sp.]MCM1485481.1 UDP-N-acetylmuramoyl-tripeptide--D-alanyl-D-alanine ligase [Faecalibacterium sp.]